VTPEATMLDPTSETGVYTAQDRHVGTVGRIILDPTRHEVDAITPLDRDE
jgi:hypothetical protein